MDDKTCDKKYVDNIKKSRKEFYKNVLKPLSSNKLIKYDFVGFDVETSGKNNTFDLGGVWYYKRIKKYDYNRFWKNKKFKNMIFNVEWEEVNSVVLGVYEVYFNKKDLAERLIRNDFKGKYITATNLGFDLTSVFYNTPYWNKIKICERNGSLIYATYLSDNYKKKGKTRFIDTTNYVFWSVEKIGKLLGEPKFEKPSYWKEQKNKNGVVVDIIVKKPKTEEQWKELIEYNRQDCRISGKFAYFLQEGFNEAGGNLKLTISSTALDVYRRGFLNKMLIKEDYVLKTDWVRDFIFKGYYGGRTEAFIRGSFGEDFFNPNKNKETHKKGKDWIYYYDINSLYPACMLEDYPVPQSVKICYNPNIDMIKNYEGVSDVLISYDGVNKPFLPVKTKEKLVFPIGMFRGVYNHNELRKALSIGYKIKEVYKQVYYTETWKPFKKYIEYFYGQRLIMKSNNNPMEIVQKLLMNSLYGRFGMKKVTILKIFDMNSDDEEFIKKELKDEVFDIFEDKIIFRKEKKHNGKEGYPILASYTTSKARIKMYDYLNHPNTCYTDTDSVVNTHNRLLLDILIRSGDYNVSLGNGNLFYFVEDTKRLGGMKLEGVFDKAYILKPKMYYLINSYNGQTEVKAKGIKKPDLFDFNDMLKGNTIKKNKLVKLKESIRRKLIVNSKLEVVKNVKLEDDKRNWINRVYSFPLKVTYYKGMNLTDEQIKSYDDKELLNKSKGVKVVLNE